MNIVIALGVIFCIVANAKYYYVSYVLFVIVSMLGNRGSSGGTVVRASAGG